MLNIYNATSEVSGAVRLLYGSLGAKGLTDTIREYMAVMGENRVVCVCVCVCELDKSAKFISFVFSHVFQISCEIICEHPLPNSTNL